MIVEIANSLTVCPKAEAPASMVCDYLETGIAKLGKIKIVKIVNMSTLYLDVYLCCRYFEWRCSFVENDATRSG